MLLTQLVIVGCCLLTVLAPAPFLTSTSRGIVPLGGITKKNA